MENLSGAELASVSDYLKQPADKYGNSENVELQWAMAAYHHAEVYFNLLISVDPRLLKLTPRDDEIYAEFRQTFPDFKVDVVNEDDMKKTEVAKAQWREFCNKFDGKVTDFNLGTLLRVNAKEAITEENTMFATRIQFLAIEIARNREGYNDGLQKKFGKKKDS